MRSTVKPSIPRPIRRAIYHWVVFGGMLTSRMRLMPDFIIIGASRSGTTSVYKNLTRHPYVLSALRKEVHFFDLNFEKGISWYRAHFPFSLYKRYVQQTHEQNFVTGEASPYYMFHPHVPKRIFEMIPQIKLIALLRNPTDRAYSHHQLTIRNGDGTLSFKEALEEEENRLPQETKKMLEDENYQSRDHLVHSYLSRGIYADQLKVWLDFFPREQFLILKSEDYFSDSVKVLNQISNFLGVPDWEPEEIKKTDFASYTKMDPATRSRLVEYFKPHNQKLYELLGVDFGWDR